MSQKELFKRDISWKHMKIRMLIQNRFNLILTIIHSKLGIKSKNQLIFRIPAGLWSCPVFVFLSLSLQESSFLITIILQ